jgi:tetratricopeptide (TPR) repeat protein
MKNLKFIIYTLSVLLLFTQCDKDKDPIDDPDEPKTEKKSFSGLIEKGPFVNGSTITVAELDENLTPTGRNFTAQTKGDDGSFEIKDIELASKYVQLSVDGFFFNEVEGKLSTSKITLMSIADLTDKSSVNVNVLTHLQRERLIELIDNGKSYAEAKKQSLNEVLSTFHIEGDFKQPEDISIVGNDAEADILLAISVIMLNSDGEAQFTELLSQFGDDLKDNGSINDERIIEIIEANSKELRGLERQVKNNIVKRYKELGLTVEPGDFENYVDYDWDGVLNKDDSDVHKAIETVQQLSDTIIKCRELFADYSRLNVVFDFALAEDEPEDELPSAWHAVSNYNANANDSNVEKLWFDAYDIIYKLNNIIENVAYLDMDDDEEDAAKGEAMVMRAMLMYHLNNYFGDIPIMTSQYKDEFHNLFRQSKADVYQFLIEEMDKASELLPADGDINKYTALSLLAKLHTSNENWQLAAQNAEKVINSGKYSLTDYKKVYTANSSEMIWSVSKGNTNDPAFSEVYDIYDEVYDEDVDDYVQLKTEVIAIQSYADVLLTFGEAQYRMGNHDKALSHINQILKARNFDSLPKMNDDNLFEAYEDIFIFGDRFSFYKRFNRLAKIPNEKLLLPIPQKVIEMSGNIVQNPGY